MRKIIIAIITFFLIVVGMLGVIRFVIGGSEDTWICVQGEWIKHGVPNAPKPTGGCGP